MPALLMRPHDFMHVEVQARGDTFDEQSLAQLVEVGERFAAQITCSPHDQVLKLQAAESIPQRGFEYPQQLADPGLPTTDPIAKVNCCREAVDQCAIEVEECTDFRSGRTGGDLRDGIGGGEPRD